MAEVSEKRKRAIEWAEEIVSYYFRNAGVVRAW